MSSTVEITNNTNDSLKPYIVSKDWNVSDNGLFLCVTKGAVVPKGTYHAEIRMGVGDYPRNALI
jgi:hypothetical protein